MALGFREAKELPSPLPKQDVQPVSAFPDKPEQTEFRPQILPYSGVQAATILGPSDPLEGPTNPDDIAGIVTTNRIVLATLQKILVATRALHPATPLAIVGSGKFVLSSNDSDKYKFFIDRKPVPCLWLEIDNFSGVTIFLGLDDEASNQNIPIPTGTSKVVSGIAPGFISILNGAQAGVSVYGLANTRGNPPTGGANFITLTAYGNSEWTDVWGMTA